MILFACFGVALGLGAPARAAPGAPGCATALDAGRGRLSKVPAMQRAKPALELIASSCRGLDAALADGAGAAARARPEERPAILAAAQRACAVADPAAPAQAIAAACPPGERDPQGAILRDLDAGTYAFVRALRLELEAAGAGKSNALLVLADLAMATAFEAEARRGKAR